MRPKTVLPLALAASLACTPSTTSRQPPRNDSVPDTGRAGDSAAHDQAGVTTYGPPAVRPDDTQDDPTPPEPAPDPRIATPALAPIQPPPPRPVWRAPYRVRLVDEDGAVLPTYPYAGRTYVLGTVGDRYSVTLDNPTDRRVEAVVSVDGLDAIDGEGADYASKRGYVVPAHGSMRVDGFRTSFQDVATFRFSSVGASYAGRKGAARDVGVIGVAWFPERIDPRPQIAAPGPYPARPSHHSPRKQPVDDRGIEPAVPPSAAQGGLDDNSSASPAGDGPTDLARRGGAAAAASPRAPSRMNPTPAERPGLGTEFGEERSSPVSSVAFVRANERSPQAVVALYYDDRAGLVAMGVLFEPPRRDDTALRLTADPFRTNHFALPPPPSY